MQQGAVLPLMAIAMLVLIGMSGLALDLAHGYLDKTRLQNALDAAALSGAKVLNEGGTTVEAEDAAVATYNFHLEGDLARAGLTPVIAFSETLDPFSPGATEPDARYIRARLANLPYTVWLARVLPGIGDQMSVGGSAVAGPSPPLGTGPAGEVCDIAPIMVCGDPADTDCSDGACFGYTMGSQEEIVLKTHSGNSNDWEVGPGNFQLIQLDCGPGGACVREELAGGYSGCASTGESVTTKPGDTVGPTAQGFNTRFNIYQGAGMNPDDYPPDTVTYSAPDFWHNDYATRPADVTPLSDGGTGVPGRRILAVPFGECTGTTNGQGQVPVLGFGCFFMTQPTSHTGNTQEIYGQLIESCEANGTIAESPPAPGAGGPILYKIILYKDPDSRDS
jgi:hypothetical protein